MVIGVTYVTFLRRRTGKKDTYARGRYGCTVVLSRTRPYLAKTLPNNTILYQNKIICMWLTCNNCMQNASIQDIHIRFA